MEEIFKDKVVIFAGCNFGIGKITALTLAKKGAKVVIADWVEDKETFEIAHEYGGDIIFIKCDLSKKSDIKMLLKTTISRFGRLDYAFNIS